EKLDELGADTGTPSDPEIADPRIALVIRYLEYLLETEYSGIELGRTLHVRHHHGEMSYSRYGHDVLLQILRCAPPYFGGFIAPASRAGTPIDYPFVAPE